MNKSRVVSATEFKAKCLSLLDEVEQGGAAITVTKRGRPVAVLGPAPKKIWKSPANTWAGKIIENEDLANTDLSDLWDAVHKE